MSVCVCLYTDTHIQHANPGLYFSSLFEVVSRGTLWDCGCVSPTQTHTLAPQERGITEKKGRLTVETVGVFLRKHTHPCCLVIPPPPLTQRGRRTGRGF